MNNTRRSGNPLSSSSKTPPPLKLIAYGVLLVFISLTFISLLNGRNIIPTNLITHSQQQQNIIGKTHCNISDHKRQLIRDLEPLIPQEPLVVWEGLGSQEKSIKYLLPSIPSDDDNKDRIVYVDLGARDYDSSIGSWFVKRYPKQGKRYHIYAVEADKAFHGQYASRAGVTLLPYAAWVRNETVVFGSKPIVVKDKVWRKRPFGRIEGGNAERDKMSEVVRVQAFDFVEWLERNVRETDFVVVKMDVEGTEIELVRDMVRRGAICLVDELFMECHFDRYVKCCEGDRINRFNYSYPQCYDLFKGLREMGVVVHQWW